MNKLILALLFAASLTAQTQAPVPYVSTFGAWTFCTNGMAGALNMDCSWYIPGTETYSLNVPGTENSPVIGYHYTITATLLDGSSKSLTGVAMKAALNGYTVIPRLVFGGIVKSTVIDVEELFPGVRVRAEGTPIMALRR